MTANHLLKALLFLFMVSLSAGNSDDVAKDFLEHVLMIPNPEKILNSVLGRLERNRQQGLNRPQPEEPDCAEPCPESLPEYTESLQTSRERGLRQLGMQKHYPICHLERKIKKLNSNEYEYKPAYYEEVRCATLTGEDVTNEQVPLITISAGKKQPPFELEEDEKFDSVKKIFVDLHQKRFFREKSISQQTF